MAIGALILGIAGLFLCGLPSLLGVILGHVSLGQIKRTGEDGRPMAIIGLLLSYGGIVLWLLLLLTWSFTIGEFVDSVVDSNPGEDYYGVPDVPDVPLDPEPFDVPTAEETAPAL
ncbi:hypothetical protein FHS43_004206 [Streptosporangium becharense]|uniref:DUF4190 domain-containing protein n=1 Tax=Streptosporangium becharense TaxID=1816182 RepID=A0A7W9MFC9_9ACTN|nr:DUF4190 domain-containing protein [Streptosporangium becharense]MBB2912911.1 hypothetical protein [Streptosporangium becharense]MBB5818264.1 hypothetical protein [Streptosporangium becharense]